MHQQCHRDKDVAKAGNKHKPSSELQQGQHRRKSRRTHHISFVSSDDVSQESSVNISSSSQSSLRPSYDAEKLRRKENLAGNLPSVGMSKERKNYSPRKSRNCSTNKRVNKSGERHTDSSTDEPIQGRRSKSKAKPVTLTSSCSLEKTQGTGASHSRTSSKIHQKKEFAHNARPHRKKTNPKKTVPVSSQGYVQHTLTTKFRTELKRQPEEEERENFMPYIPSGSKVSQSSVFIFPTTLLEVMVIYL